MLFLSSLSLYIVNISIYLTLNRSSSSLCDQLHLIKNSTLEEAGMRAYLKDLKNKYLVNSNESEE
jgi:hypothetical protein